MQLSNYNAFPSDIPIVIDDTNFLYPFMIAPLFLNDDENMAAVDHAMDNDSLIFVATNKEGFDGNRTYESIYDVGVIGSVMRKVALPDGRTKVLFQGLSRGVLLKKMSENPLIATADVIHSDEINELKAEAILTILRENVKALGAVSGYFPPDLLKTIEDNHDLNRIIELISSTIKLTKDEAYAIYAQSDLEKRLYLLIDKVVQETQTHKLQKEIKTKVNHRMERVNKEYYLKEQLKQIQDELGVDNSKNEEIEEYYTKLEALKKHLDEDGYKEIKKQIDRFSKMHPDSSEANMIQNYIEVVLEIPFGKFSKKRLDVSDVSVQLDKDHYSLKKPKDRIVEFFAVKELLELRGKNEAEAKGTILCFIGPPGVGKTSLANSIATALKRQLVRIALGGLEDVSELRGHRRTYIGAMPGRVIQGLTDAKVMNPVVVLDEIDKVGRNLRGDPTSALLEILDPEQNTHFRDNYLNFAIDLSKSIFIATANDASTIPAPLRDRMEFIEVSSYTPQEKFEIAKKYLIPQELKKHGLAKSEVNITKPALQEIIQKYVREAGVRNLRRKIATIVRKSAKLILEKEEEKVSITLKNINEFLDKPVFEIDKVGTKPIIGEVNGLAWTAVGGDVLKIEAIKVKGKGAMQLTGSLGDVMKESAHIAKSAVKVLIDSGKLKIDKSLIPLNPDEIEEKKKVDVDEIYKRYDIHLHVPEGATPKDGPSAGITMATAISSILSDIPVRPDVAMTGEITLSGKVLPIGGLKEKLIAAHKANIKLALIPMKNYQRDLEDLPDEVKEALEIVGVEHITEVLKLALVTE
jgi:ATP-dependent Lon protease